MRLVYVWAYKSVCVCECYALLHRKTRKRNDQTNYSVLWILYCSWRKSVVAISSFENSTETIEKAKPPLTQNDEKTVKNKKKMDYFDTISRYLVLSLVYGGVITCVEWKEHFVWDKREKCVNAVPCVLHQLEWVGWIRPSMDSPQRNGYIEKLLRSIVLLNQLFNGNDRYHFSAHVRTTQLCGGKNFPTKDP